MSPGSQIRALTAKKATPKVRTIRTGKTVVRKNPTSKKSFSYSATLDKYFALRSHRNIKQFSLIHSQQTNHSQTDSQPTSSFLMNKKSPYSKESTKQQA